MKYAQFFQMSTGYVSGTIPPEFRTDAKKPIPACGSDSVFRLDGRFNLATQADAARAECKRRGFVGFTLNAGERYTTSRETRKLELVA